MGYFCYPEYGDFLQFLDLFASITIYAWYSDHSVHRLCDLSTGCYVTWESESRSHKFKHFMLFYTVPWPSER